MPRFTVLMPTHYRPDVIGYAIQSVLDQTESDFELLVVGDGATEGTEAAVARFSDPRIRWFDLPKAPYFGYANRNVALEQSTGELIAFLGDDDLLFPDHLQMLGEALSDGRRQVAYSQALWVSTDGIAAPCLTNLELGDEFSHFARKENSIAAACFVYRASALPTRSAWPEDVTHAADWHMWRRLIGEHGRESLGYVRVPTCLHFSAARTKSRYSNHRMFKEWLAIADAAPWWPDPLRVAIPEAMPEQAVFSDLMRSGSATWNAAARKAATDVTARIAYERVFPIRPKIEAASAPAPAD